MIVPNGMCDEQLRGSWGDPVRQPVVVLGRWFNLPAHDQEHDVDYGNLLGESTYVRKGTQDVGEQLGQGVSINVAVGVDNGGEVRILRAHQSLDVVPGRSTLLALGQKVEQDGVKRACGGQVARQCEMGHQDRGMVAQTAAQTIGGDGVGCSRRR